MDRTPEAPPVDPRGEGGGQIQKDVYVIEYQEGVYVYVYVYVGVLQWRPRTCTPTTALVSPVSGARTCRV